MKKPIRYVVINPPIPTKGEDDSPEPHSISYSAALGEDAHGCNLALFYARQNVNRYGGEIFVQLAEGEQLQPLRVFYKQNSEQKNQKAAWWGVNILMDKTTNTIDALDLWGQELTREKFRIFSLKKEIEERKAELDRARAKTKEIRKRIDYELEKNGKHVPFIQNERESEEKE